MAVCVSVSVFAPPCAGYFLFIMVLDILSYKNSLAAKYGQLFSDVWLQYFIDYWYAEDIEVINLIKFNPLKNYGS